MSRINPELESIFDVYDEEIEVQCLESGEVKKILPGTPALEFLPQNKDIVAVSSNKEILSLQEGIDVQAQIQPVYKQDSSAIPLLIDTLSFLLQAATKIVLSGETMQRQYDIGNAMYFQIDDLQITETDVKEIEKELTRIVELNIPIKRIQMSHADALEEMLKNRHLIAHKLLQSLNNPIESLAEIQRDDVTYRVIWRSPYLAFTGVCKGLYKLIRFGSGILLYYSTDFQTVDSGFYMGDERLQKQMCAIKQIYRDNAKQTMLGTIADVNQLTANPKRLADAITAIEFNHERQIASMAASVPKTTRAIFLAGPSSSNKTTTSNRVAVHLRARGFEPVRVSLDDFYNWPAQAPRVPGTDKPDFEHLEALDLPRLRQCLKGLVAGEEVVMARYDFKKQQPGDGPRLKLSAQGVLIIEGIHALNDEITSVVPAEQRLRIFVQPIGALAWDETRIIDHLTSRLIRRMCRDYIFRGHSAERTMESWAEVRKGEDRWILPNQPAADFYFNSSLVYEQFIMRVYAVPLLQQVPYTSKNYGFARQILRMLAPLAPIPVSLVPEMSLLWEFLPGGSQYEDFSF